MRGGGGDKPSRIEDILIEYDLESVASVLRENRQKDIEIFRGLCEKYCK
jgi:hypothetical protein